MACQGFCHSDQKNNCPRWAHWLCRWLCSPPSAERSSGYWVTSSVCTSPSCWTECEESSKDFQTEASVSTLGEMRCLRRGRKPFISHQLPINLQSSDQDFFAQLWAQYFISQILVWLFFSFYWIISLASKDFCMNIRNWLSELVTSKRKSVKAMIQELKDFLACSFWFLEVSLRFHTPSRTKLM